MFLWKKYEFLIFLSITGKAAVILALNHRPSYNNGKAAITYNANTRRDSTHMNAVIGKLKEILYTSGNTVFFGGAGVSTESGIPDFRSAKGLYSGTYPYPPETILSHSFFLKHTGEFYRFYREKMLYPDAKPNKAHVALAKMEEQGKLKAVITQNVDGLHTKAGSVNVMELHGSALRNICMSCGSCYPLDKILQTQGVPLCSCGGIIKPDVVLYEENLDMSVMIRAADAINDAEVLIVGGTSLNVYPAAGMIANYCGNKLVLINKSETPYDYRANLIIRESIGHTLWEASGTA